MKQQLRITHKDFQLKTMNYFDVYELKNIQNGLSIQELIHFYFDQYYNNNKED